ncbi:unnamed protein product [Cylindrotheca closterium]|uniref:Uncharacterized protein n=1 Tax=Cylindrotheca closterium TaxID=2856 RepID=A0AAD2CQA6_9STRA|nr:unnamed protein product [Cylindrotheca closterium]
MLQRNEFVSELDVQAIIALALDLTIIVLLIMAVEQMEALAMETLAMAIDDLALVSLILATRTKDSRMVEIVIHKDLQTTIKEDQVATTKTSEAGCFVPDGTVPVEDQGRMPSAVEQHAEDQPEQNDQYFVQGQFVQSHEQNEMYPPPEELYPPEESYPPQDDQGYYPYGDAEHYSYEASTPDHGPMTQDKKHFLLNDSLIRVPTPKQTLESTGESMNKKKLTPISLMQWGNIGGKHSAKPLQVLFDSGGETTMIHARSIPQGAMVKVNTTAKPCATVSRSFNANKTVELRDGLFPEFDQHWRIYGNTVTVFDAPNCPHDIILGRDFLDELGILIDFQNHQVRWIDKIILMKSKTHWQNHTNWTLALDHGYLEILDDDDIADDAHINIIVTALRCCCLTK